MTPESSFSRLIDSLYSFQFALIFVTLFIIFLWRIKQRKNLPPGPWRFPILGHLPWIKACPHAELTKLIPKYGNIFHVYLGNQLAVVLGSYELINEALVKQGDNFASRPMLYLYEMTSQGYGLVMSEGRLWKEQRRFVLSALKDLGFGKTSMEDKIKEEIHYFLKILMNSQSQAINPRNEICMSISNNICSIIFGKRFEYDDPKFHNFLKMMTENLHLLGSAASVNFLPFLRFLPGGCGIDKIRKNIDTFHEFYDKTITEHLENIEDENNPHDFIETYLIQMKREEENNVKDTTFTRRQFIQVLQNIFDAGTDTTATSIQWALLLLMVHPEIQSKVQEEIDLNIGNVPPCYEDRNNLPYTEAVIMEVLRYSSVLPMPVHTNKEDVVLDGYHIPKNTIIFPLIWAVHRDPKKWESPELFKPERFLDSAGHIIKPQAYIPFSIGRRICMGESLAKLEIFLYITCILQRFTIKLPDGYPRPSLESEAGLMASPYPFEISAVPRF